MFSQKFRKAKNRLVIPYAGAEVVNCKVLLEIEAFDLSFDSLQFSGSSAANEDFHGKKRQLKIPIFGELFAGRGRRNANGRKLSPFFELQDGSRLSRASEKVMLLHFFQNFCIKSPCRIAKTDDRLSDFSF